VRCAVSKHDGPTFDEFDLAKLPLFRTWSIFSDSLATPAPKRRLGVAPALVRPKCPMQRSGREGMSFPADDRQSLDRVTHGIGFFREPAGDIRSKKVAAVTANPWPAQQALFSASALVGSR
jgi:hypothetical protein